MVVVVDDLQHIVPENVRTMVANRKIYVLFGAALGLLLIVVIAMGVTLHQHVNLRSSQCLTSACLRTSAHMLETLNDEAVKEDRCKNFYRYACGGWMRSRTIPSDKAHVTVFSELYEQNLDRLRRLVESPIRNTGPKSAERKLKQFYRMCLHEYGRTRDAGRELIRVINDDLRSAFLFDPQGWSNSWNFTAALIKLQRDYQVAPFFQFRPVYYLPLPDRTIPSIAKSGLGMDASFYTETDEHSLAVQDAYKDYMRGVAELLLRDSNRTLESSQEEARVEQFVNDVYGQEEFIAKALPYNAEHLMNSRVFTLGELMRNFTQIPFAGILSSIYFTVPFYDDSEVYVFKPWYLKAVNDALLNESLNNVRDRMLNNYFLWRLVDTYAPHLSWEYRQERFRFQATSQGTQEFPPVHDDCMKVLQSQMVLILASEFVRQHTDEEAHREIDELIGLIRASMTEQIDQIPWMDDVTKARAKEKANSIESFSALPNIFFNSTFVDEYAKTLEINPDDGYFKNLLNTNKYVAVGRSHAFEVGKEIFFWSYLLRNNGFGYLQYLTIFNRLVVGGSTLQFPLYSLGAPEFFNYGALGADIAEMMSYSVNDIGQYVWSNGSVFNWWTNETQQRFLGAEDCLDEYYQNVSAGPYLVDGVNKTLPIKGENHMRFIMDTIMGLRVAFKAYKKWSQTNMDSSLPGLDVTSDQGFFLSAAQTFCYLRRDEAAYNTGYLPNDIRINGALTHMREFSEAFQCGENTPMKPDRHCPVF